MDVTCYLGGSEGHCPGFTIRHQLAIDANNLSDSNKTLESITSTKTMVKWGERDKFGLYTP